MPGVGPQQRGQQLERVAVPAPPLGAEEIFGDTLGNHLPPGVPRLGAEVDQPVGGLDHIEIVLDDDHRVLLRHQAVQHLQQLADVVEVQAGRRFVQDVERAASLGAGQFSGQLDALRLAPRECRRRLPQREIVEPHRAQRGEYRPDLGNVLEQFVRLANRHLEHIGNRPPAVTDRQGVGVEPLPPALVALDPDIGQKVHLDLLLAVPLARFAPPAGPIETESPFAKAADLRLGERGIDLADQVEHPGVGRRIGRGRAPQGLLVHLDELVDLLEPTQFPVLARGLAAEVEVPRHGGRQRSLDQRTFPRTTHASDAHERPQRNAEIDPLQVVMRGPQQFQPAPAGRRPLARFGPRWQTPFGGDGNLLLPPQVLPGQREGIAFQLFRRALGGHCSAKATRAGAEVVEAIGRGQHLAVVLDQQHGVPQVAQAAKRLQQASVVTRMQANGRFIEHVQHAGQ